MAGDTARLRGLPSVDQVLKTPAAVEALAVFGHAQPTTAVRGALSLARAAVRAGAPAPDAEGVAATAAATLAAGARSTQRPVFNLTGTVLHTNLGRALLA